jgi:hypothetical protein
MRTGRLVPSFLALTVSAGLLGVGVAPVRADTIGVAINTVADFQFSFSAGPGFSRSGGQNPIRLRPSTAGGRSPALSRVRSPAMDLRAPPDRDLSRWAIRSHSAPVWIGGLSR